MDKNMSKEKVIEAFEELRRESQDIVNLETLSGWRNKAVNVVRRVYGNDSSQEKQILKLEYRPPFKSGNPDNIPSLKQQAFALFEGLCKEIERFDVPMKNDSKENQNFHFNIVQSQSQQTKINLSFLIESIQEELKGSQLKELQTIIDDKMIEPQKKKVKIFETLKKFGSDVASNIVANILTNPSLYS